ncbi:MAG: deoxyribose-phosphate aldolase [Saprospiraceae bacterium]
MSEIAKFIEQTLLKPDTNLADLKRICEEAKQMSFFGICVPPYFIREARRIIDQTSPKTRLVTVVGYPMGYTGIAAKSEEIKRATEDGADEIDAMVNIAAIKSAQWNHVRNDIESLALATNMRGRTLKLILECGLLNSEEIAQVCEFAENSRIAWFQTGTDFNGHPVTPEMVRMLRALAPANIKIKAAGGIHTFSAAQSLLDAGADRIGTSAGVDIVGDSR